MTTLELIRDVDDRLAHASDNEVLELAASVQGRLAEVDPASDEAARLAWRADQLGLLVRALDL